MVIYPQLPSESAGDYVYRVLRKNIIQVVLSPGQCISPVETAAELNVSRTPIQGAFSRLAADGLLDVVPQRGSYVSIIDLKRVYESVYMRNLMDQAAIRYLCESARLQEALISLEANIRRQEFSLENNLLEEVMELDDEFHNIVYQFCEMDNVRRAVDSISADQHRVRHMKLYSKIRWGETVHEHALLLRAMGEKDADKASRLSYEHVAKFGVDIDSVYRKHPTYFSNWDEDVAQQYVYKAEVFYNMKKK